MNDEPGVKRKSPILTFGAAVALTIAAAVFRMALTPLIGPSATPFITFYPAVLVAAWYGGFRAGALSVLLSAVLADYFFVLPVGSLIPDVADGITLLIFVLVAFGMVFLTYSQVRATERADREAAQRRAAESAEREERRRFETTLTSIGDAVIATDPDGQIVFANRVAHSLLRSTPAILGKPLDEVFHIVNELSRAPVESPVAKVLRAGSIVGLANHTVLVALDGTEMPIDDSAAPITDESGKIQGTVLVFRDVTARRRAEATSRLLASIVESSEDAVITKDLNGMVTSWNKGAERIFGYAADEMLTRPISVIAAPDRANEMPALLEQIKRGQQIEHYETVRRTKSGALVHISLTLSPLRDSLGRIVGASKIARDISERKESEEQLRLKDAQTREARDWLQTTLVSIGDAVIATDATGRVNFLNPVAQSLTGWTQEQAAGKPLDEIFIIRNEETGAAVENPVDKVLREGTVVGLANHTTLISKDGPHIPIDDSAAPLRDAQGNISGVVLVFRDITERKRAEDALRRTAEFDEAVMANMGEGLYTVDAQGLVTFMNPAAERLFGWRFEELRDRKMHDMTHHHHPDGTPFPAEDCAGLQVLRQGQGLTDHEDVFIRKDGTFFDVVYSSSPLRSGEEILGLVVVFRDVSERKRAVDELRRANEDLNQFAFAASHDLQEPLRMVSSYSQLLVKGFSGQLDGEAALCVNFITEGTKRMRELLADLLAYTQVNSGEGSQETNVLDLNRVVQKALENCKAAIDESQAVVTVEPLPTVRGYEPHFLQLLQNLIGNAIKYRGERAPRVHVSAQETNSGWRLGVADNGIGIDPQYHDRIFGVFKRLHGKEIPGTGIGLAICQRVVERYSGRIWVESQVNEGATFYCTLPATGKGTAA